MAEEIQFTFKCPQCGCATFEEILVNVTQSTAFERVNCDEDITEPDYQNTSTDGGEIDRYQCQRCGFILKDEQGQTIAATEGLRQWLDRNGQAGVTFSG
jgi:rubredoxin